MMISSYSRVNATVCLVFVIAGAGNRASAGIDEPSKVSAEKTLQYWKRVHQTPSVSLAFTDPVIIHFNDGTELNQFEQFAPILRKASLELLKIPTIGVHPELVEWNIKASMLLELRAISFDAYNKNFKRYVNPLGGFNMAADSMTDFLKKYSSGGSLQSTAAKSVLATFTRFMDEIGNAYQAVRRVGQEVAREKYIIRSRISNQIGIELPLDEDGCPVVTFVMPDGPAEKAGIQPGDILILYNSDSLAKESREVNAVADAIEKGMNSQRCRIRLLRNGDFLDLSIPTGKLRFEFREGPANLPIPWDDRYFTLPKGWTDSYPFEKKPRDKMK